MWCSLIERQSGFVDGIHLCGYLRRLRGGRHREIGVTACVGKNLHFFVDAAVSTIATIR
jgi:hypothetical protein